MAYPNPYNKTPHDGTGTTVTVVKQTVNPDGSRVDGDSVEYIVTSLQYNLSSQSNSGDEIDVSNIGQDYGEEVLTQPRPLVGSASGETGREFQFDFIGTEVLDDDQECKLTISGPMNWTGTGKVTSSSVTLATNDVIRGSLTIAVERKPITASGDAPAGSSSF